MRVCVRVWLTNQFHLLALAKTRQLFISIVYSAAQIFSNSNKNFIHSPRSVVVALNKGTDCDAMSL